MHDSRLHDEAYDSINPHPSLLQMRDFLCWMTALKLDSHGYDANEWENSYMSLSALGWSHLAAMQDSLTISTGKTIIELMEEFGW